MLPEVLPPERGLTVIARPHPLSMDTYRVEFPHGLSIRAIVGPDAVAIRVEIGGYAIPEAWWDFIRPKPGVAVVIVRFPQGGNAKQIFRLIAFAALAVGVALISGGSLLAPVSYGLGDLLGVSYAVSAGLLAAGVGLVGSLVINALIPPTTPNLSAPSTNLLSSITGTGNQVNRYGVIPCVLGTALYYPPYAALPRTEYLGDDQYLRCLFDLGYGDPDPSDMKIGNTDLSTYTDVQTEIGTNPDLFPNDILEESIGVELDTDGNTATRTTGTNASEISIDLVFASGLFGVDKNGKVTNTNCVVKVEESPNGAGTWTTVFPTCSFSGAIVEEDAIHIFNSERKAVRCGVYWVPSAAGEYDVRVTRVSTDYGSATSDGQVGGLTWTVLRTMRHGPSSTTGTKKLAIRIKASDQLSGNLDQFNCIISQPVPVWKPDTSSWVTEASTNPAWLFRWVARDSPANPRQVPAERIDDDALIEWGAECDAKGLVYSGSLDQPTTVFQLLKDICAAGRAAFGTRDGKYTVVRDIAQSVPVQVFTPRNSWSFSGTRAFPDSVHALRCQFINPEANWQQDERIVYDDGYGDADMVAADGTGHTQLATNFEQLTLTGCTDADAAWRLGRYHLAVSRLRPNTYTWNADIENLVCNRGDLVLVASDVIGVGLSWGRIKRLHYSAGQSPEEIAVANSITLAAAEPLATATAIELDEECTFEEGKTYAVRLRKSDGTVIVPQVTGTIGVPTKLLQLATSQTGLLPDDLLIFGELDSDSIPLIVTRVEPDTDLSAKITAVDAAPDVLNADAGTPPAWSSQISGQPWLEPPAAPDLLLINSNQALSSTNDAGNTSPSMTVTVSGPWSGVS